MSLLDNKYITIYRDIELEAFYEADFKYRRKIIIAHMMIHLLPVLIILSFYWYSYEYPFANILLAIGILMYFIMIGETISYLFPKSRHFYKENLSWLIPALIIVSIIPGFFVGYEIVSMNLELKRSLITGFSYVLAAFVLFFWSHVGLSQVFHASRALYKRKAEMEADMRFATEVQNRILKNVELEHGSTQAYACSIPANELGGDYFELSLHNNQLFTSIGDISGHSFGAGLLMTMTKSALQTHLQYNEDPSKIMSALNSMLYNQTEKGMYATMNILKLNLDEFEAVLCNAGHLPVIHIPNKTSEIIHRYQKGIGLGITRSADYHNLRFPIGKDDLLILYSDGLIETRDENMQIRDAALFDQLIKETNLDSFNSPKEIADLILENVRESDHAKRMEDDSTIIIIKV